MSESEETPAVEEETEHGPITEDVLQDVEAALNELVGIRINLEVPADLERARKRLPTEPRRAMLVHACLPRPLRESLEYVRPSDRQGGYWRRSPERSDPEALSPAQLRSQIAFAETQINHRDVEGTVKTLDGREIPETAKRTAEELRGKDFTEPEEPTDSEAENGRKLLRSIRSSLRL